MEWMRRGRGGMEAISTMLDVQIAGYKAMISLIIAVVQEDKGQGSGQGKVELGTSTKSTSPTYLYRAASLHSRVAQLNHK